MVKQKQTPEEQTKQELEARVDAMMDVNADGIKDKPLDIFAGQSSPVDSVPGAPPMPKSVKPESEPDQTPEPVVTPQVVDVPESDEIQIPTDNLDTPQSDEAIKDIVAQEADEVLAAQDAGIERELDAVNTAETPPAKHGHPIFWFIITLLVILIGAAAYVVTSPGLTLPFGL